MTNFSFTRFKALVRYEALTNYRAYIKLFLIVTGLLLGVITLVCDIASINNEDAISLHNTNFGVMWALIVGFMAFFTICEAFTNMRHTPDRMQFLLIPASNAEKILQRITVKTLAVVAVSLLGLLVADVTHMLIQIIVRGSTESALWYIFNQWLKGIPLFSIEMLTFFCCMMLFPHAYAVFVSAFIRKGTKMAAPLLAFALGWMFLFLISCINWLVEHFHLYITISFHSAEALLLTLDAFVVLLSLAFYAAAYWKFGRLQIRNSRFFN